MYPFKTSKQGGWINNPLPAPSILTTTIKHTKSSEFNGKYEDLSCSTMSFCSRFQTCSAPICPLDPFMDARYETQLDPKCRMAKATRHKYWQSMPEDMKRMLPYEGYLRSEFNRMTAARERWDRLSELAKENLRNLGKKALEKSRRVKR